MEFLSGFILGMMVSAGMIMGYGWYQVNKFKKIKESLMDQLRAKATDINKVAADMEQKKNSIKERLFKASEIAQQQMAVRAQMEMPSKNALHSRYKNGMMGELQDMEQQKLDLLRTVLAEGFDPMITVINEAGVTTEVPLSTYVNDASDVLNTSLGNPPGTPPPPPTDGESAPKRVGKFVLYKGGKDDGTTH